MKPLLINTAEAAAEKIYSFTRCEIFSPKKGSSTCLKFCTVTGEKGAKSKEHTHPGDEIVISLHGGTTNFLAEETFILTAGEALSLPPQTEHSTEVHTKGGWQGISFYCDDCLLLKTSISEQRSLPTKKNIDCAATSRDVFSPCKKESSYLFLSILSLPPKDGAKEICNSGETVYYCTNDTDGFFHLHLEKEEYTFSAGTAIYIPAGEKHTLYSATEKNSFLLTASCSYCLLHKRNRGEC